MPQPLKRVPSNNRLNPSQNPHGFAHCDMRGSQANPNARSDDLQRGKRERRKENTGGRGDEDEEKRGYYEYNTSSQHVLSAIPTALSIYKHLFYQFMFKMLLKKTYPVTPGAAVHHATPS